jgi:hypothetical protein
VAENQINKEPLGVERRVRRPLNSLFVLRFKISARIFASPTACLLSLFCHTRADNYFQKNLLRFMRPAFETRCPAIFCLRRNSKIFNQA